jgi:acyl dehydratase
MTTETLNAEGPYFDELHVGQVFASAPAITLTDGLAATHQAIVGGRLPLALDHGLAQATAGRGPLPSPALVWDLAIGQSTVATQHVKANLFYRGLVLHRLPGIGDTLRTVTVVEGLRQNQPKPERASTGLAALHITTVDQDECVVLDFWRCAMIALSDPAGTTSHSDDLGQIGSAASAPAYAKAVDGWDLGAFASRASGPRFNDLRAGMSWTVAGGDVISEAPSFARLCLNIASVHHDSAAGGGQRLVYGGHTISLALAQASRALPGIVTVTGWESCDHVGPVHEGDTLRSTLEVEQLHPLPGGGGLVHLRSQVTNDHGPVLDWRFVAVLT